MSKKEAADNAAPRTRVPGKTAVAKTAAAKVAPAAPAPKDEARPVLEIECTERNALLSSLRAQTSAKKATQEHLDEARRLLDAYKQGTSKDKVELLLCLRDKGVKNLNWTHQFTEKVTHDSTTECASTGGMFTKSKKTLEDLLTEAETLYGYDRQHVPHKSNRRLDRWFYKWAEGETSREVFGAWAARAGVCAFYFAVHALKSSYLTSETYNENTLHDIPRAWQLRAVRHPPRA